MAIKKNHQVGILIIRGGDPAIGGHSALPIGPEAETNRPAIVGGLPSRVSLDSAAVTDASRLR